MSFGFGISDFEYVFNLVMRVKNFLSDIASAPSDWNALRAEADCLGVCLKVIRYKQSRRILREISRAQRNDLLTIIKGCRLNMEELTGFVAQMQSIAIAQSGERKPPRWSFKRMWDKLVSRGVNLWNTIRFVNKDKQPMREKLAIPTQSLNIFLVSLTFISLSYNGRLSAGPGGSSQPPWMVEWEVVGVKVAFKDADFSLKELMKPGVEDAIIECAEKKVAAGSGKGVGKKPAGSGGAGGIKVPKKARRKSSFGPRVSNTDPDGLFLVRDKNRVRSRARSKARLAPSVEIVKADYDFGSDSGSSSVGFDGEIISPRRPRSPTRGGGGGAIFEDRSPDHSPRRGRPSHGHGGDHGRDNSDDEDETSELLHYEKEGYKKAKQDIKKDRKRAIREMTHAVMEEAEASSRISSRTFLRSAEPGEPDVRAYMEVRYGIIIDRATEQEEVINTTSSRTRIASYMSQAPRAERSSGVHHEYERTEDETVHRSRVGEHLYDSEVSSDSDSDPEIILTIPPESRYRPKYSRKESKDNFRRRDTVTREDLFTIPRTEYTSRTETYEGRTTTAGPDRNRERFLQQQERFVTRREEDLEQREQMLRERECALLERERHFEFGRRAPSPGHEERPRYAPEIIIQPHERPMSRYHDDTEIVRLERERPGPSVRRAGSYAGPPPPEERYHDEVESLRSVRPGLNVQRSYELRRDHPDSDEESTYERRIVERDERRRARDDESRHGYPVAESPPPPSETRTRRRTSRSPPPPPIVPGTRRRESSWSDSEDERREARRYH